MRRFLTTQLDRWTIRMACRMQSRLPPQPANDTAPEARELLASPQLLALLEEEPTHFQFNGPIDFTFPSAIKTPWPENNIVHGRLFRCGLDWRARPSVILLHGWNANYCYRGLFPGTAKVLNKAGFNAGMIQLPYHGPRRPRRPDAIRDFISEDLARMIEATHQAVADTQSFINWLRAEGSSCCGVWGFSLGAWLAGLLAGVRPGLAFAILTTPMCHLEETISTLAICRPIQRVLDRTPLNLSRLSLSSRPPLTPASRVLIQEARHDQFVSNSSTEALWRAWKEPPIWRESHGHISILASRRLVRKTARWAVASLRPA